MMVFLGSVEVWLVIFTEFFSNLWISMAFQWNLDLAITYICDRGIYCASISMTLLCCRLWICFNSVVVSVVFSLLFTIVYPSGYITMWYLNPSELDNPYRLDDLMSAACEGNVLISIILIRAGYYIMILRLNLPTITQL